MAEDQVTVGSVLLRFTLQESMQNRSVLRPTVMKLVVDAFAGGAGVRTETFGEVRATLVEVLKRSLIPH